MKKPIFSLLLLSLLLFVDVKAQELTAETITFGTDVQNREVVNADTAFSADTGTIFCYTHITGAEDSTRVTHVWYYKDEEKARVKLDVKSSDWRTWSSKKIQSSWTGTWRVMVEDTAGNVLGTGSFVIEEQSSGKEMQQ